MTDDEVLHAYAARAAEYESLLGSVEDMGELDRRRIERWAGGLGEHGLTGPVLDAGCGPGHWTHFLQGQGLDVSGVDLVPEFIRSARVRFPNVPFRVASLRALDLPDGHHAGVLAWYSLIHFAPTELPAAIMELRRVLQPQGRLLVGFFEGESGEPFDHAVTTAYYWSVDEMSAMLRDAGFEVLDVESRQVPGRRPHAAIAAVARSEKTS